MIRHLLPRAATLLLFALLLVAPLTAQDQPPDPSGLDAAAGTPASLPTREPRPAPIVSVSAENTRLDRYFEVLPQGETGLLRLAGTNAANSPIIEAHADLFDKRSAFFSAGDQGWFALVAASIEQATRDDYPMVVSVSYADGTQTTLQMTIMVVLGSFIRQNVSLPADKGYLLDIETERNELARLESIYAGYTELRTWDETGFQLPISANLTSPFGAFRTFNGTLNTRHTGWDIRTTLGQQVMSSAAGRVVFSGWLDIRGNHIIIDHGYGVYSGYSHFDQVNVRRGDTVTKGQILGLTGATGRTSGPHFHWEMAVNGSYVDSVQFITMWMP
jgi:murein DD-endopeptidase MepM/ murein hydrolase activator NlpD